MPEYKDGDMVTGSVEITVEADTYKLYDFEYKQPSTRVVETDENGEPSRAILWTDVPTFSGSFQVATDATTKLTPGLEFTLGAGDYAATYILETADYKQGSREIKKGTFVANERINALP